MKIKSDSRLHRYFSFVTFNLVENEGLNTCKYISYLALGTLFSIIFGAVIVAVVLFVTFVILLGFALPFLPINAPAGFYISFYIFWTVICAQVIPDLIGKRRMTNLKSKFCKPIEII